MPRFIDMSGHRYGRWLVLKRAARIGPPTYWECQCDCGRRAAVSTQNLRSHQSTSCGCKTIEATSARSIKHGATIGRVERPEYRAWKQAKVRCYGVNSRDFPYYGGRGIKMAEEWREDFAAFLRDMGPRPEGYTLDRIDTNGDYAPGNCRWASRYTQSNNTRQCVYVTHQGQRMTLSQVAALNNVDYSALRQRVKRGQSHETALFALLHGRKRRNR